MQSLDQTFLRRKLIRVNCVSYNLSFKFDISWCVCLKTSKRYTSQTCVISENKYYYVCFFRDRTGKVAV